ncbi:hypothetical protein BS17DRAFT_811154 [Gyrodon lividus]|nr:hypothetical protein BS17DRAFT_811154 [Gyrodon lividus]
MSQVDILPPSTPIDFQASVPFADLTGFRETPSWSDARWKEPDDPALICPKSDSSLVDEKGDEKIFTSLPPLLRGHPEIHLRNGIMNASRNAAENRINAEKAFFVADLSEVYRQHKRWLKCLPGIEPHYAIKCNPDPYVLRLLASLGAGFDCASNGEISQVLNIGGIDPSRIIFANPCKATSFIRNAAKAGVDKMTFDNADELYKISRAHPGAKLIVRILADDSKSICRFGVKFGAPLEVVPGLLMKARELHLDVIGVSFHVGSGCYDPSIYEDAVKRAREAFDMGLQAGYRFSLLDVGGGFEDARLEAAASVLNRAINQYFPDRSGMRLIAEPGRYYVSRAFSLATNIIARRASMAENISDTVPISVLDSNEPSVMYYINDGVYGAFNCILFDHQVVEPYVLSINESFHVSGSEPSSLSSVWGPTCDSMDCVCKRVMLPSALQVGDWLGFNDMGAYTICAASQFNGFELSDVLYTTSKGGEEAREALRSVTFDDEKKEPSWEYVQVVGSYSQEQVPGILSGVTQYSVPTWTTKSQVGENSVPIAAVWISILPPCVESPSIIIMLHSNQPLKGPTANAMKGMGECRVTVTPIELRMRRVIGAWAASRDGREIYQGNRRGVRSVCMKMANVKGSCQGEYGRVTRLLEYSRGKEDKIRPREVADEDSTQLLITFSYPLPFDLCVSPSAMTSGLFQDPVTSSPSTSSNGPRFRPYASPNHQVTKGRYITSNDPRGYIPVYEYPLNGQWIMMDIDDGYILWTGIWKALGNSKADIVKMIDSQPDLAPVIRRVRGGYLKIQGTWMPYEVALRLSRRVAWPIRDDLVPLFGPTFPSTCLSPDQAGYGQVVSTASGRRRARRTNQSAAPAPTAPHTQTPWSSTIPVMPGPSTQASSSTPHHHSNQSASASPRMYNEGYPYPSHRQIPQHIDGQRVSPPVQRGYITSSASSPLVRERSVRSRYSPYPGSVSIPPRKASTSTSESLSLDMPSISLHDPVTDLSRPSSRLLGDQIKLPPIQPLAHPQHINNPSYALPPISALEDLRGISSQDSAAVLERLKMDDVRGPDGGHWARQRSVSTSALRPAQSYSTPNSWSGSFPDPFRGRGQFEPTSPEFTPTLHSCHEGSSASGVSPVSPATPRSTDVPNPKARAIESGSREHERGIDAQIFVTTQIPSPPDHHNYPRWNRKNGNGLPTGTDTRLSVCRHSGDSEDSESEYSKRPIRPW